MYSLSRARVVLVVSEHEDGGGAEGLCERGSRRLLAGVAARRPRDIPHRHDDLVAGAASVQGVGDGDDVVMVHVVVLVEVVVLVVLVVLVEVPAGCAVVGVVGVPGAAGPGDDGFGLGVLTQRWTLM